MCEISYHTFDTTLRFFLKYTSHPGLLLSPHPTHEKSGSLRTSHSARNSYAKSESHPKYSLEDVDSAIQEKGR